ncbi:hypothetical protein TNIN_24041 [Trichonephila inaurata madagascariensis]|uniref:Uncharacterized protein n=1 Tax=Trichonephila inaurata madagascariensis TaxID=2747483 RepID=A0A8X6YFV8_9ARAC|nr:hypothetical protein TNIN_24041 [Trichonephila inaurata madagascariensis]
MDPQFYPELTDALPWKPDGGSFLLLQSRCHGNQRINPEAIVPARVSFGMRPECENYMPKEGAKRGEKRDILVLKKYRFFSRLC